MNMLLQRAIFGALMQANPEEQSNNNPAVMPTETHGDDAPIKPGDVQNLEGKNWGELGRVRAQSILAAEQGVEMANKTVAETKVKGILEMLEIGQSEQARATYHVGVQSELLLKDGGTMTKTHNNFVGMLKRVSKFVGEDASLLAQAFEIFKGEGKLEDKIAKIPATGKQGGHNKGGGAKGAQTALADAIKQEMAAHPELSPEKAAENVRERIKLPAAPSSEPADDKPTEKTGKPTTTPTKPDQQPSGLRGDLTREVIAKIGFLHENGIEAVAVALASRCNRSQQYSDLGKAIVAWLDKPQATGPGSVLTGSEVAAGANEHEAHVAH